MDNNMDLRSCVGCTNYHTEGTQFPCRECKRFDDTKTTDHYYEEPKSDPVDHPAEDPVNHPKHYADTCSLECIEAMQIAFGKKAVADFCLCNAFKYLWRHKNKNGQEDLRKAQWYLDKADELIGLDGELYGSMPEQLNYMDDMVAGYTEEEEE